MYVIVIDAFVQWEIEADAKCISLDYFYVIVRMAL